MPTNANEIKLLLSIKRSLTFMLKLSPTLDFHLGIQPPSLKPTFNLHLIAMRT